jgi:hypothetical protein
MSEYIFICRECSLKCELKINITNKCSPTSPVLCGWGQKANWEVKK